MAYAGNRTRATVLRGKALYVLATCTILRYSNGKVLFNTMKLSHESLRSGEVLK